MNLKELTIEGYKSIGKITISNPNPFTVFVGPNASGKSNIFEALDLFELCDIMIPPQAIKRFGNINDLFNQIDFPDKTDKIEFNADLGKIKPQVLFNKANSPDDEVHYIGSRDIGNYKVDSESVQLFPNPSYRPAAFISDSDYNNFTNFTRLFIGKSQLDRRKNQDDTRLNGDASNLEKVLKRILKSENYREEIFEILQLLIPGFESVEIKTEELSGTDSLIVRETNLKKPLPKSLISDGTYTILAIITALYQSDQPQFLCIEEPENGLNPFVVKQLVKIIRNRCKEQGHYIWLNTHSQTLVSQLTKEEIIIVDKINGLTEIKQITDMDLHGLRMDDALYTNAIGGGNPW